MNRRIRTTRYAAKGVALLVVLALVMAITVLSLAFLTQSSTELACGHNMALRMQMDQTATSGLEHARGLLLGPPPETLVDGYWAGATAQQLDSSSADFYDVSITPDATDHCNYEIACAAYRLENAEKIGLSTMSAQLRLDPCIALSLGLSATLPQGVAVTGDVFGGGHLVNHGVIDGDVFAHGIIGGASQTGKSTSAVAEPPLTWPNISVGDYDPSYQVGATSYTPVKLATSTHPTGSFGPYASNPGGVRYRDGDARLPGNVSITGSLVVDGDLRVSGSDNTIAAVQSFPALVVSGDLIVESGGHLTIDGLALVQGAVKTSADAGVVSVTGGMLVVVGLWEMAEDSSGNGLAGTVHGAATWSPSGGRSDGALQLDGVDDYVDCGNDANFRITDKITLAAWIKTNEAGNGAHHPFVTKGDRTYALKHNASNSIEFFIYDPVAKWISTTYAVDSSFNDQWHHVAGTYDGADVKLYIDGLPVATTPGVATINNLTYTVSIGGNSQETDRFYNGAIDEVRIYARALNAAEILQLHDTPALAGDTSDLRARYGFDEAGSAMTFTVDPPKAACLVWTWDSDTSAWKGQYWSQAAGAFFKSVRRE